MHDTTKSIWTPDHHTHVLFKHLIPDKSYTTVCTLYCYCTRTHTWVLLYSTPCSVYILFKLCLSTQFQTTFEVMNVQPNRTHFSGSCESTTATLLLNDTLTILSFTFTLVRVLHTLTHTPRLTLPLCSTTSALTYVFISTELHH